LDVLTGINPSGGQKKGEDGFISPNKKGGIKILLGFVAIVMNGDVSHQNDK
jgi:hypothetical protein